MIAALGAILGERNVGADGLGVSSRVVVVPITGPSPRGANGGRSPVLSAHEVTRPLGIKVLALLRFTRDTKGGPKFLKESLRRAIEFKLIDSTAARISTEALASFVFVLDPETNSHVRAGHLGAGYTLTGLCHGEQRSLGWKNKRCDDNTHYRERSHAQQRSGRNSPGGVGVTGARRARSEGRFAKNPVVGGRGGRVRESPTKSVVKIFIDGVHSGFMSPRGLIFHPEVL